jgi:hypothetical protein
LESGGNTVLVTKLPSPWLNCVLVFVEGRNLQTIARIFSKGDSDFVCQPPELKNFLLLTPPVVFLMAAQVD